jgi:hypothetical protein
MMISLVCPWLHSPLLPLLEVVQRAHPSYNPKGVYPRQAKSWPRFLGPIASGNSLPLRENSSLRHYKMVKMVSCLYTRSCNRHTPLIIQEECARASQKAGRAPLARMQKRTVPSHVGSFFPLFLRFLIHTKRFTRRDSSLRHFIFLLHRSNV